MIKIDRFPISPSHNKLYSSVRGRLIKSAEARKFDSDVDFWAYLNRARVDKIKSSLDAIRANGSYFKVDIIFVFHKARVFSKKGTLKRLDPSNRLKSAHDNLARILGFDDTLFISGSFEKAYCDDIKQEQCFITITEYHIRSFNTI